MIGLASAIAAMVQVASAEWTPANPTIIVRGQDEEQRRQEIENFVRELGVANGQRTAARWVDQICPSVIGLAPEHAAIIKSRVRAVARQSGARVAENDCEPNIMIAFAGDGRALVRSIRTKAPGRLAEVAVKDRPSLFDGRAAIRWWYSTDVRDSSRMPAGSAPAPWTAGNSESGGSVLPMNENSTALNHYGSSLVSTQVMRALRTATILVDANLAEGHTLSSVADFVALVALAEIGLDARPPNSVLGLFSSPDAPKRMSARDQDFLQALYRLPLDRTARQHRSRLVNDMVKPSGND